MCSEATRWSGYLEIRFPKFTYFELCSSFITVKRTVKKDCNKHSTNNPCTEEKYLNVVVSIVAKIWLICFLND